jgi:hypothetical protein
MQQIHEHPDFYPPRVRVARERRTRCLLALMITSAVVWECWQAWLIFCERYVR